VKLTDKLKTRASQLKHEVTAVYYAYRNPALPWLPRILAWVTIAYALSPIDLIPDFIPVLGYLDDLVILPLLITLAIRNIPPQIMTEAREKALSNPIKLPDNWFIAALIIAGWVLIILVAIYLIFLK